MDYGDGKGNTAWLEYDSYGTTGSGWYSGTGTYTVAPDCYETSTDDVPLYVNPNGTGAIYANFSPNSGRASGVSYTTISAASLPSLAVGSTATCSAKTLSGTYATSTVAYESGLAYGYYSRRSFSANGKYTFLDVVENGTTVTPTTGSGTYTVAGNCTVYFYDSGSTTPSFAAIVAPNGSQYWWVNVANTGTLAADHATQVSPDLISNAAYP
jgi:hypothetical protein